MFDKLKDLGQLAQLASKAQKVQQAMKEMQDQLGSERIVGDAGAGRVTATVNGAGGKITSGATTITSSTTFTLARSSNLDCSIVPDAGYDIGNVFVNGAPRP